MNVLGAILVAVTFPGVIVREGAHLFFCRSFHLAIFEVRFLGLKRPFGHVQHERARSFGAALAETLGPFCLNAGLCVMFATAAFLPVWELKIYDPLAYVFYWLGFSFGVHAFPARADLRHLWELTPAAAGRGNVLAVLAYPLVALLYLIDFARPFWADALFGVALAALAPPALFQLLA
jgi:hypothetical protein